MFTKIANRFLNLIGLGDDIPLLHSRYLRYCDEVSTELTFEQWRATSVFNIKRIDTKSLDLDIFPDCTKIIVIVTTDAESLFISTPKLHLKSLIIKNSSIGFITGLSNIPAIDNLVITESNIVEFNFHLLPRNMCHLVLDHNRITHVMNFPSGFCVKLLSVAHNPLVKLNLDDIYLSVVIDTSGTKFENAVA